MEDGELLEKPELREGADTLRGASNVYPFAWRGDRELYEPYKAKLKVPRLEIRYKVGLTFHRTSLAYRDLLKVEGDETGTEIELIYRIRVIKIRGKNMVPVLSAINSHNCDFILEFIPLRHIPPASDAPIIHAIEFPLDEEEEKQR